MAWYNSNNFGHCRKFDHNFGWFKFSRSQEKVRNTFPEQLHRFFYLLSFASAIILRQSNMLCKSMDGSRLHREFYGWEKCKDAVTLVKVVNSLGRVDISFCIYTDTIFCIGWIFKKYLFVFDNLNIYIFFLDKSIWNLQQQKHLFLFSLLKSLHNNVNYFYTWLIILNPFLWRNM